MRIRQLSATERISGISREWKSMAIPSIMVCDGPHGLRKKDYNKTGSSLSCSVPSICFPTAVTTACSWDPDLLHEMGVALGKKCLKEEVGVLLGPGVNMKRSPLCGRNFEYFSEDPLLTGVLAAAFIEGVQAEGAGAVSSTSPATTRSTSAFPPTASSTRGRSGSSTCAASSWPCARGGPRRSCAPTTP